MIPALRQQFNANFTLEKYQRFLKVMEERCATPVKFRFSDTPCFFPKPLLEQMSQYGKELIHQLEGLEYRKASFATIPPEFNVPHEAPHPMFIQVDFGLVRDKSGKLQPKLVERQGCWELRQSRLLTSGKWAVSCSMKAAASAFRFAASTTALSWTNWCERI